MGTTGNAIHNLTSWKKFNITFVIQRAFQTFSVPGMNNKYVKASVFP